MKLILCPECEDVVRLRINEMRYCSCKKSGGMYTDRQNAIIEGRAIPIGISNQSLIKSIGLQEGYSHPVRIIAFTIPVDAKNHVVRQSMCSKCQQQELNHLIPIDHSENYIDYRSSNSFQGYKVYRCNICGEYWGCRYQWDAGSGSDDKWKAFGKDPDNVRRHY